MHLDMQAMTTAATVSDVRLSCCEGRHPCNSLACVKPERDIKSTDTGQRRPSYQNENKIKQQKNNNK